MSRGDVFLLDDDPAIRAVISIVLSDAGYSVTSLADGPSLLNTCRKLSPVCVLLDLHLAEASGIEILKQLRNAGCVSPVVMISGKADIGTAVEAMKSGAQDFLEKPFDRAELLGCIDEFSGDRHVAGTIQETVAQLDFPGSEILSPGEKEMLALLTSGLTSKEIAIRLGLNHRTVEDKRARIMKKLGVKNAAQLIHIVLQKSN